jgi:hypothetical protein
MQAVPIPASKMPPLPSRLRDHWPLAVALVLLTILQGWACAIDLPRLIDNFTIDDTYLYLQVALNAGSGKGFTFDGLHRTNGFQPLWLFCIVPLATLFREPVLFLRASLALCALFNLGTTAMLYRLGCRLGGRRVALLLLAGWLWMLSHWKPFLSAMETSLYLLVFTILLDQLFRERNSPLRLSLLGGLLVLCRLDAIVFTAAALVAAFAAARPREMKTAARLAAPLLTIVMLYLGWNQVGFGHHLPVSGRVKTIYHKQELGDGYLGPVHARKTVDTWFRKAANSASRTVSAPLETLFPRQKVFKQRWFCLAALCCCLLARRWRWRLGLLALAGLVHMLIMAAAIGRFAGLAWYYAPLMVLVLIGVSLALDRLAAFCPRRLAPLGLLLLTAAAGLATWTAVARLTETPERHNLYQRRYRMARWMAEHLPGDAVVGSWNAGQVAYFSGLTVVNLDGLVNDQSYADRLEQRLPVLDYLEQEGIGYLADYDGPDLSMPPRKRWDSRKMFRGEVPRARLQLMHREQPGGKAPKTMQLLKVLPRADTRRRGTDGQGTKR